MKVWLVEIFIYCEDDEYGYIAAHYRDNKVFDQKVKALNYLRDFRKKLKNNNVYRSRELGIYSYYIDESKITEIEL